MISIIKASIYKLLKDWTFRITMIIGLGLAALLLTINGITGTLDGDTMMISSVSPAQNFGLTVPINLIVFTVGEFTFGTLRNKIIAGHSKFKLYVGLFITGLIFTFSLMFTYFAIMVGIGSAVGGFNIDEFFTPTFVGCFVAYFICAYIFVTSYSVFVGTLFRQVGGSISLVVVLLVILGLLPLFFNIGGDFGAENVMMWINPLHMVGFYANSQSIAEIIRSMGGKLDIYAQSPAMIAAGIITPIYWAAIFFVGGALIFSHRDIK